jgi:IS605 OrfB family transposase
MKLTVAVQLQPTPEQANALRSTLEQANAACNEISTAAWTNRMFGQFKLHKLVYGPIRASSGLSAQVVVRCIAKVADAYKLDRKRRRTFKPHGSIAFDDRILRWYVDRSEVSVWTVAGRQRIPFVCGERAHELLKFRQGESDLVLRDDRWYLFATVNVEEPPPGEPSQWLGVDLGIVNIATDSDGTVYSGTQVNGLRRRHRKLRQRLQSKGTRSAKRLLRKRRRKERRFATDVNHLISKRLVAVAKGTGRGIALEDLQGIHDRLTVRKPQRAPLRSWSFFQLRQFVSYKARLTGVAVVFVDPRNSSRTCPRCGLIDKRNRPSQAQFSCVSCGLAGLADHIAALNVQGRASVNAPDAAGCSGGPERAPLAASPRL